MKNNFLFFNHCLKNNLSILNNIIHVRYYSDNSKNSDYFLLQSKILNYDPLSPTELEQLSTIHQSSKYHDCPSGLPNKRGAMSVEELKIFGMLYKRNPKDNFYKLFPFRSRNILKEKIPLKIYKRGPFTEEEKVKLMEVVKTSKDDIKKFQSKLLLHYPDLANDQKFSNQYNGMDEEIEKDFNLINWRSVYDHFPDRSPKQIRYCYKYLIDGEIKKNVKYTKEEDQKILALRAQGYGWNQMEAHFPGRMGMQLRSRYIILTNSERGEWSQDELERLVEGVKLHGFRWLSVSEHVGTRHFLQCAHKYIPNRFADEYRIKPRSFNKDELLLLNRLSKLLPNKISLLTVLFPGHTMHQVRYWHEYNFSRISIKRFWSEDEKGILVDLFLEYGMEWEKIVNLLPFPTTPKDVKLKIQSCVKGYRMMDGFDVIGSAVIEKFDSEKESGKNFIIPKKRWYIDPNEL